MDAAIAGDRGQATGNAGSCRPVCAPASVAASPYPCAAEGWLPGKLTGIVAVEMQPMMDGDDHPSRHGFGCRPRWEFDLRRDLDDPATMVLPPDPRME